MAQSVWASPPVELRYEPALHAVGALAPAGQIDPAGQSMHAVSPLADWKKPASHASHALAPSDAEYLPGLQAVSAVARSKQ